MEKKSILIKKIERFKKI